MAPRDRSELCRAVGTRVRGLREEASLTQRELAERSGLSPRYLAQLEAGDANLSLERLSDLASAVTGQTLNIDCGEFHS